MKSYVVELFADSGKARLAEVRQWRLDEDCGDREAVYKNNKVRYIA